MQLAKVREVGEAVSVVAVLITLVFLILEVRENTAAIRTESYGESIMRMNEWRMQLAAEPELTRLFAEFNQGTLDRAALTPTQRQQFYFVYYSLWSVYESAWFAWGYGTLGDAEWTRFELMMCRQYSHASREDLWPDMNLVLSPDFRTFAEATCA